MFDVRCSFFELTLGMKLAQGKVSFSIKLAALAAIGGVET